MTLRIASKQANLRDSRRRYYLSLPDCTNCGKVKLQSRRSQALGLCAACEDTLIRERSAAKRQPVEIAPEGSPGAWW